MITRFSIPFQLEKYRKFGGPEHAVSQDVSLGYFRKNSSRRLTVREEVKTDIHDEMSLSLIVRHRENCDNISLINMI